MNGKKLPAFIATLIIFGGTGAVVLASGFIGGSSGTSTATAGKKIAATYNAGTQQARIIKVLKCLKGKDGKSFLCAFALTPDGSSVICVTGTGVVTPKATKIVSLAQADPTVCYFAS